ncbi:MAG TPA: molybdenum cofactor guanylyltransferase [Candidatus Binataceae bacterium]|jgi:molybdopterin-guanine dinucleotide biosynthesis protein A|nr:molybdenum cofactor guanylyltransferase [Candidatus Binataceae bacterium]
MNPRSAVILAGGRSSRMGLPKAALPFGRSTILERLLDTLNGAFGELIVVAAPLSDEPFSIDRTLHGRTDLNHLIERDDDAFAGPVGALRRGLERASGEIVFACSCDLPLLQLEVASALCAMLADGDDAVIPQIDRMPQPLCAAYRREPAAAALAAMAAAGEARLRLIAELLRVRTIEESALRAIDADLRSFINVNTAEDYARALRLACAS